MQGRDESPSASEGLGLEPAIAQQETEAAPLTLSQRLSKSFYYTP